MEYKVLKNFTSLINNQKIVFKKNQKIVLDDEVLIKECVQKNIIEIVPSMDTINDNLSDKDKDEDGEDNQGINPSYEHEGIKFLSPEEIRKLKTKDDVIEYGQSIGLDELNNNFKRDELEEMVIEYIENLEA